MTSPPTTAWEKGLGRSFGGNCNPRCHHMKLKNIISSCVKLRLHWQEYMNCCFSANSCQGINVHSTTCLFSSPGSLLNIWNIFTNFEFYWLKLIYWQSEDPKGKKCFLNSNISILIELEPSRWNKQRQISSGYKSLPCWPACYQKWEVRFLPWLFVLSVVHKQP